MAETQIPWWLPEVGDEELQLLEEVVQSNFLNDGEYTERFEHEIAERLGSRHAVAVTSGTTALYLALVALDIGPGDEVIVPDVTFIATASAVTMTSAMPVLVDVDAQTLNIDVGALEAAITPRTKAVIPVHVSGRAADMPTICEIADRHGIAVIEDAAEALLSKRYGRYLGTHGAMGCFSFSPNKTITTGQGGMVVTDDDKVHLRLRQLKDQGRPVRGTGGDDLHPTVGFNFKLTNLQSAVGLAQLTRLEARTERMRETYRQYVAGLRGVREIELLGFDLEDGEVPQWVDVLCERRDDLDRHLGERRMGCRRFWHPLHVAPPYRRAAEEFPVASSLAGRALWLPSAFTLSNVDIANVCTAVREFYTVVAA